MPIDGSLIGNYLVVAVAFTIYLLPIIVAAVRRPMSLLWILPLNILLGWTLIAWVIALGMSLADDRRIEPARW